MSEKIKTTKVLAGSDLHFSILASNVGWNFLRGKDFADMQTFARLVWDAAMKSTETPQKPLTPEEADMKAVADVRIRDEGAPSYLDGVKCQFTIERGDAYPNSEVVAYVFNRDDAERVKAALAASQPVSSPTTGGWISVSDDRKPALKQVILMWVHAENEREDDDGNPFMQEISQVQMGEYRDTGHGPYFDCFATPFADHEGVTHWMPLPPAPQGKED